MNQKKEALIKRLDSLEEELLRIRETRKKKQERKKLRLRATRALEQAQKG